MPLKAAWCSGVHPSLSLRSTVQRPRMREGIRSSRPFLAAMCRGERPFLLPASIRSRTLLGFSCWCRRITSRQSFLPQKTAAVSAVQPLPSRWFGLARLASSSRTSSAPASGIPLTSWSLATRASAAGPGAAPPPPGSGGGRSARATSRLPTRRARRSALSAAALQWRGSALARSSVATSSGSVLSAARSSAELPSPSAEFGSACLPSSCSTVEPRCTELASAARSFSSRRSLATAPLSLRARARTASASASSKNRVQSWTKERWPSMAWMPSMYWAYSSKSK
mmetsp:Transcript_108642/g.335568  ORF Transcript_108642/g.335568 Transcript_108642/m.335568 type:complete len:283 (-) Transcript_108642:481-1329(-)